MTESRRSSVARSPRESTAKSVGSNEDDNDMKIKFNIHVPFSVPNSKPSTPRSIRGQELFKLQGTSISNISSTSFKIIHKILTNLFTYFFIH